MLENYKKFLEYLQSMIDKNFADQAPYIKCKQGCSHCCEKGDYPFSAIEVEFLKEGFLKLNPDLKQKILDKIRALLEEKKKANLPADKTFFHCCPFLIDRSCSVYFNRGIICRTFGLIHYKNDDRIKMPFCSEYGLNYAEVIDPEKNIITQEKLDEAGYGVEPKSYNLDYDFVTREKISDIYDFKYGKKGPLLDVLAEDEYFKSVL